MQKSKLLSEGGPAQAHVKKARNRRVCGLPGAAVGRDRRLRGGHTQAWAAATRSPAPHWALDCRARVCPASHLHVDLPADQAQTQRFSPRPSHVFFGAQSQRGLGMECYYIALGAEKEKLSQLLKRSLERKVRRKINIELSRNFLIKVWFVDQQHTRLLGAY